MKRSFVLALGLFFQAIRDKVFGMVVLFFLFLLGFAFFLGQLSVGETATVLQAAGFSGIEFSALILVIVSLCVTFYREKEMRLTEIVLVNVSPQAYLGARLAGYIMLLAVYIMLAGAGFAAVLGFSGALTFKIFAGLAGILLKTSLIAGCALAFCCIFSSYILAIISSVFIYLAAEAAPEAARLSAVSHSQAARIFLKTFAHALPAMGKLDMKMQVIFGQLPSPGYWAITVAYTCLYLLFLWSVATLCFIRKES